MKIYKLSVVHIMQYKNASNHFLKGVWRVPARQPPTFITRPNYYQGWMDHFDRLRTLNNEQPAQPTATSLIAKMDPRHDFILVIIIRDYISQSVLLLLFVFN